MKKIVLLISVSIILLTPVYAQRTEDIDGGKDYPLISRFEGSVIEFYKETKWNKYMLPVGKEGNIDWNNPMALEGRIIRTQYTVSPDNNSAFVLHNYKSAFRKAGFDVLIALADEELGFNDRPHTWHAKYYDAGGYYNGLNNGKFGLGIGFPTWQNNHCFIAARGHDGGNDIYAVIYAIETENCTLITQDIIEVETVETGLVSAASIAGDISSSGHIAIYDIRFDGDRATIKSESEEAIANIAVFFNDNPDEKYFIVGHAAGIGDFEAGLELSKQRAEAVIERLIDSYGVDADQLEAHGVGALCPLASNDSTEGAAKNRRVEIVKK